ncbi:hypothetical protein F4808DRAFT_465037 [Astrocystis sublimbata]|nr:hypothetical protein F4808DRAFT_465037 [Astrocystis sublimbata]
MADTLGVVANIFGITAPTLHWISVLSDDIRNISEAPNTFHGLQANLSMIDRALKSLQAIPQSEWEALGTEIVDSCQTITSTCKESCRKFREDLQGWTRNSNNGKLSALDRTNLGLKEMRTKSMSD